MISTWTDAEEFAAQHMRSLGFEDASTTSPGADGGIDVRASRAVAQVKHFSDAAVGSPAVQQLAGARNRHEVALFYALSGYSRSAVAVAEELDVALFVYSAVGEVSPVSARARTLVDEGFFVWYPDNESAFFGNLVHFLQDQAQLALSVGEDLLDQVQENYADAMASLPDEKARSRRIADLDRAFLALSATARGLGEPQDVRDILEGVLKIHGVHQWLARAFDVDLRAIEGRLLGPDSPEH